MYNYLEQIIKNCKLSTENFDLSTSVHFLNGDTSLDESKAILYLLLNHMNNIDDIESINIDKQIFRNTSLKDFKIDESTLKSIWENFDKKSSPSRKVGDIFWSQLN